MLFWCYFSVGGYFICFLGTCIWFGVKMSRPGDGSVASGSGSGSNEKQTDGKVRIRNTKIGASGRVCAVHGCHNHDSGLKRWLKLLCQEHGCLHGEDRRWLYLSTPL